MQLRPSKECTDQSEMIRTIQPTSALPVTRNMPYTTASVPSRHQPRNMTGIYLGLEGNTNPPKNRGGTGYTRPKGGMSQKIRTTSEDRRYRMVELLRIKEEKRGFIGQPLKAHPKSGKPQRSTTEDPYERRRQQPDEYDNLTSRTVPNNPRKWGPAKSANPSNFDDVIRQNPRNFTGVMNNGVTRSENLTGYMSFAETDGCDLASVPMPEDLVEEVQRLARTQEDMAGLEECFRKVCKGNTESLHSLLPLRKGTGKQEHFSTGFQVRSYRNPNKAELLADFEIQNLQQHSRPKTVPASQQNRQAFVPAPYFFKYYNKPQTAISTKKRTSPSSQFEEQMNILGGDKIFGASGSGAISRSIKQRSATAWSDGGTKQRSATAWSEGGIKQRSATAWSEGGESRMLRRGTPRTDSAVKDFDRGHNFNVSGRFDPTFANSEPLEIRAEGYQHREADDKATPLTDRTDRTLGEPPNTLRSEPSTGTGDKEKTLIQQKKLEDLVVIPSKPGVETPRSDIRMDGRGDTIRLDLETADGKKQEIFLDDKAISNGVDHVDQVRASEAKFAAIKEHASKRKQEFEQILNEHAEIVTQITRQSSHPSHLGSR